MLYHLIPYHPKPYKLTSQYQMVWTVLMYHYVIIPFYVINIDHIEILAYFKRYTYNFRKVLILKLEILVFTTNLSRIIVEEDYKMKVNKAIYVIVALFLGEFSNFHKFYADKFGQGLFHLLFFCNRYPYHHLNNTCHFCYFYLKKQIKMVILYSLKIKL